MGVKLLAEKAGALQGIDADSIARQAYGPGASYNTNGDWEGYVGAIVRQFESENGLTGGYDVLDLVLEVHEV